MNALQVFESSDFGEIRSLNIDEALWFVAADVCRALEIANTTQAVDRLDDDERAMLNIGLSGGATNCVSEPGLYTLMLGSRKPKAKAFKRWITHDVVPALRKHGMYATPAAAEAMLNDPDVMIRTLQALKTERAARVDAEQLVRLQAPKVLFADAVETSHTSILVGDLAKLIKQNGHDMGQNKLFTWMRVQGYLISRRGESWNAPTQRAMELKLFEVRERVVANPDGTSRITRTTKVTGKGQVYFINKLCSLAG